MREIFFRGKRVDNSKWVEGSLILNPEEKHPIIGGVFCEYDDGRKVDNWIVHEVISETVGQFTRLNDKNGVRIFEGDILKTEINYHGVYRERITEIKFNDCIENDSFGEPATIGYCIHGTNWVVIGNIHDNPELLINK